MDEEYEEGEQMDPQVMKVMQFLSENSGKLFTSAQLAKVLGTDVGQVANILRDLENKGYLKKEVDGKMEWFSLQEQFQQPPTYEPTPEDLRYIG